MYRDMLYVNIRLYVKIIKGVNVYFQLCCYSEGFCVPLWEVA